MAMGLGVDSAAFPTPPKATIAFVPTGHEIALFKHIFSRAISHMPPSKKPVPRTPRSPKEDGEVGETLNDVLARHPSLSPGMQACLSAISQHSEVISPKVAVAVGRLVSAALSPMPCKADPQDARDALKTVGTEMLPARSAKLKRAKERHAERLWQLAQEAAKEVQRDSARGGQVSSRRAAIAARPTRQKRTVANTTRVLWE